MIAPDHMPFTKVSCCAKAAVHPWDALVRIGSAYPMRDLERTPGGLRIACVGHRYQVMRCTCGHEAGVHPTTGILSFLDGRSQ